MMDICPISFWYKLFLKIKSKGKVNTCFPPLKIFLGKSDCYKRYILRNGWVKLSLECDM